MPVDLALLAAGFGMLAVGGELLVRGASGLARSFGISPLVVGLTVVAFATSAPELAVNLLAAVRGSSELSFGNIVGSNLANIGLILGVVALVRPIPIESSIIFREIPMMLLATLAAVVLALDELLNRGADDLWSRADGVVLLGIFVAFLYYMLTSLLRERRRPREGVGEDAPTPTDDDAEEAPLSAPGAEDTPRRSTTFALAGLALLVIGGELTVRGGVGLARSLGLSEAVIGLTLIAIGTSLPELAASVMAVVRGFTSIALGNVVGSNIFNLLLVGGATAIARPIEIPEGAVSDLAVLAGLSLLLWMLAVTNERRLIRLEASLLLTIYTLHILIRTFGPAIWNAVG